MNNSAEFKIIEDSEFGVVLQCFDTERADQFDDFLIDNFNHEVHFQFEADCVKFLFGKTLPVSVIIELYNKFEKDIPMS